MSVSSEAAASSKVETLRWTGDALDLIDQRALPSKLLYARCSDAREVAAAIRDMVVRGAPAIGCAAAFGVALEALRSQGLERGEFDSRLARGIDSLAQSRPTAVNL
ncbi:MAG: S-methyl-5-thioribose-1-phosphate isomerase, partial [Betaproteobacteria bacterium]|nr:S-methyl-5-thioribose-1-phosphate isomerase [Betaproteobacteria bacterium]